MTSTFAYEDLEVLRNRAFGEIVVGDRAAARSQSRSSISHNH